MSNAEETCGVIDGGLSGPAPIETPPAPVSVTYVASTGATHARDRVAATTNFLSIRFLLASRSAVGNFESRPCRHCQRKTTRQAASARDEPFIAAAHRGPVNPIALN